MKCVYSKWPIAIILFTISQLAFTQSRIIINGGFEPPQTTSLPATSYSLLWAENAAIPEVEGWKTTASTTKIEVWHNNFKGFSAAQGSQFAELNSTEAARLYQDVCLSAGETLSWEYYHRGRSSATVSDVSELNLYNSTGTSKIIVLESASDDKSAWGYYAGSKTLTVPSGMYQFSFEAISTANGDLTTGNFLDGVQIKLVPFVEFTSISQSGQENLGNNLPKLRINGQVPIGGSIVTLSITGGTATRNVDYTLINTMTIPSGFYPPSTALDIPLTIIDDAILEGNETIQLRIVSASNTMLITDANCDGTNGRNTSYTITDNDALPVDFLSFDILPENNSNILKWQTANETNNKYFIIERSFNGSDFDSIGIIQPQKDLLNHYSFDDPISFKGISYYRIKQVDFDGMYTYSMVRTSASRMRTQPTTYPNPFKDRFRIAGFDGWVQLQIIDVYGNKLVEIEYFDSSKDLDLSWLNTGTYILQVSQNEQNLKMPILKVD